jgi:hypothetical protein
MPVASRRRPARNRLRPRRLQASIGKPLTLRVARSLFVGRSVIPLKLVLSAHLTVPEANRPGRANSMSGA